MRLPEKGSLIHSKGASSKVYFWLLRRRRRAAAAKPTSPDPSSIMDAGSGTGLSSSPMLPEKFPATDAVNPSTVPFEMLSGELRFVNAMLNERSNPRLVAMSEVNGSIRSLGVPAPNVN